MTKSEVSNCTLCTSSYTEERDLKLTSTCMRVLANSIGKQAMQAKVRDIDPASKGAYGVKCG
jgi:hypothetical protein